MNPFAVFAKKEISEIIKTYRWLIISLIAIALGFSCPIFAKLTPKLLEDYVTGGITINVPEPTYNDSWYQYFKDCPLICLVSVLLCFVDSISGEVRSGSIINMLTKGVSRTVFYLSKYSVMVVIYAITLFLCFEACNIYTNVLFEDTAKVNFIVSYVAPLCFGILLLSLLFLFEVVFLNVIGSLGGVIAAYIALMLLGFCKQFEDYNPVLLFSNNSAVAFDADTPSGFAAKILVALIISTIATISGIIIFKKKQI